jgi:hypothetical protein
MSRFHSEAKRVPFKMFTGESGPPSRKGLISQSEVRDFISLSSGASWEGDDWSRLPEYPNNWTEPLRSR